jgi:hypothetical protein
VTIEAMVPDPESPCGEFAAGAGNGRAGSEAGWPCG